MYYFCQIKFYNHLIYFYDHKDDHTRVKLKNLEETDYINANFVECEQANRKYILAQVRQVFFVKNIILAFLYQGPLKTTCEHFWQMVWEQNTKGIIMLNKLFEKGSVINFNFDYL